MIERFALKDFTAFGKIKVNFSRKVNVIIGENGTGKTHLLKAAYALSSAGKLKEESDAMTAAALTGHIIRIFKPLRNKLSGLVRRGSDGKTLVAADFSSGRRISVAFADDSETLAIKDDNFPGHYRDNPVYIPSRETLSFMMGFAGLSERYELPFDGTFRDICLALDLPPLRDVKIDSPSRRIMDAIEKICGGTFMFPGLGSVAFRSLDEDEGQYSAGMTAEGFLQMGILYRLLENGSIAPGESGPLFWDEPETSLSPKLLKVLAWILLELARNGQQIVLATHSYVLIKFFDLLGNRETSGELDEGGEVRFHSLHRGEDRAVRLESVDNYDQLPTNSIVEAYLNIYDTEVERSLGRKGQ